MEELAPVVIDFLKFLNVDLVTLAALYAPVQWLAGWLAKNFPSRGRTRRYNVFMRLVNSVAQNTGMAANADQLTDAEKAEIAIARIRARQRSKS